MEIRGIIRAGAVLQTTCLLLTASSPAAAESNSGQQCQENLSKIDGSKEQFALEYRLANGAPITWQNILDPEATGKLGQGYLKRKPVCPEGGTYTLNKIGQCPTCSIGKTRGNDVPHILPECEDPSTSAPATATASPPTTGTLPSRQ